MPKFIINTNGVYKRNYSFMMNIMDKIFEIRRCIEILASTEGTNSTQTNQTYNKQTWTQNTGLIDWAWFYVCANTI